MDWLAMATMLRLTEIHLEAWQQALSDARLIVQRAPRDEGLEKLEALLATSHVIMGELQREQACLIQARSRKLASLFHLQGE